MNYMNIVNNTVPRRVRQDALRAIKSGKGLNAVHLANEIADGINRGDFNPKITL